MTQKVLTILGSTGSIGSSTLDIVRKFPDYFQVFALSCNTSIAKLIEQIREFSPKKVCVGEESQVAEVQELFRNTDLEVYSGAEGLKSISTDLSVDLVVAGIVGAAGLKPLFAAIQAGRNIALANKEPLVLAGALFMQAAKQSKSMILPMDSEHNAIFQSMAGHTASHISKLILTASGGPFRDRPLQSFKDITLKEALQHPNWEMGNKITIDSATMMNKGLEIIEAHWLFNIPVSQIDVVLHRESIIHSMVEYRDGSFISQMGMPDMRIPIAYCLAYPNRLPLDDVNLNISTLQNLSFSPVSDERYPCLGLAVKATQLGGNAPAVLNGANEYLVAAYLDESIHFLEISSILQQVMSLVENKLRSQKTHSQSTPSFLHTANSIDKAIQADQWGRDQAQCFVEKHSN